MATHEVGGHITEYCVYAGLAGDTDSGRFVSAGLYRARNGDGVWESLGERFARPPQVRAILSDARHPSRLTIGAETGIWRSDDSGDTWRKLNAPAPLLAVWSLARHPTEPDTIFAGYEPAGIYRSTDDGENWQALPLNVTFPEITARPEMPKRVLGIAVDPANSREMYAGFEIGGVARSLDGGRTWEGVTEGTYINEDSVDVHAVAISPSRPGVVTVATRIGTFRSADRGHHWRDLSVPMLRPRGTYCRAVSYAPSDPATLYLAGGNDFDGDRGALFASRDDGGSWQTFDLGLPLKTTVFALAVNSRLPDYVLCATKIGQVFRSADRGKTWQVNSLPAGVGHVYSLAVA